MTRLSLVAVLLVLLVQSATFAQSRTYTNVDLDKKSNVKPAGPEVYAALKLREYRAPAVTRPSVPVIVFNTSATPWDWPVTRIEPASYDVQPFFYGLPWFYQTPFNARERSHTRHSERKQPQ